jgi:broad specificity phosphatase PhoE
LQRTIHKDLHENDRTGFAYLPTLEFEQKILEFFNKPDEHIMGNETARQAQKRFARQIDALDLSVTTAVIAHGTVNSLFTALHNDIEVMNLWKGLELPSFVVLELPRFQWDGNIHNYKNVMLD